MCREERRSGEELSLKGQSCMIEEALANSVRFEEKRERMGHTATMYIDRRGIGFSS